LPPTDSLTAFNAGVWCWSAWRAPLSHQRSSGFIRCSALRSRAEKRGRRFFLTAAEPALSEVEWADLLQPERVSLEALSRVEGAAPAEPHNLRHTSLLLALSGDERHLSGALRLRLRARLRQQGVFTSTSRQWKGVPSSSKNILRLTSMASISAAMGPFGRANGGSTNASRISGGNISLDGKRPVWNV